MNGVVEIGEGGADVLGGTTGPRRGVAAGRGRRWGDRPFAPTRGPRQAAAALRVLRIEDGHVVEVASFAGDVFSTFGLPPALR